VGFGVGEGLFVLFNKLEPDGVAVEEECPTPDLPTLPGPFRGVGDGLLLFGGRVALGPGLGVGVGLPDELFRYEIPA
jgi:hypothetical protein